jgi:hypothetical protein
MYISYEMFALKSNIDLICAEFSTRTNSCVFTLMVKVIIIFFNDIADTALFDRSASGDTECASSDMHKEF